LQELDGKKLSKMIKLYKLPHSRWEYCCSRLFQRCSTDQDLRRRIVDHILDQNTKHDLLLFFELKIDPVVKNRKITATFTDIMQVIRFSIEKFRELHDLDINHIHRDIVEGLKKKQNEKKRTQVNGAEKDKGQNGNSDEEPGEESNAALGDENSLLHVHQAQKRIKEISYSIPETARPQCDFQQMFCDTMATICVVAIACSLCLLLQKDDKTFDEIIACIKKKNSSDLPLQNGSKLVENFCKSKIENNGKWLEKSALFLSTLFTGIFISYRQVSFTRCSIYFCMSCAQTCCCYCCCCVNEKNHKDYIECLRLCKTVHCSEHSNCRRTFGLCTCLDYVDITVLDDHPFVEIPTEILGVNPTQQRQSENRRAAMRSELSSTRFENMESYI